MFKNSNKKRQTKKQKKRLRKHPNETYRRIFARIKFGKANKCKYYKKMLCILCNKECDPSSFDCNFESQVLNYEKANDGALYSNETIRVKAVVLSHNKKCIHEEHHIYNVQAVLKILKNNNVIDFTVPAVYCKECNQYIILKSDFKSVQQKGILLCQVIDKTPEYISKHKNSCSTTESRIHSLGYNVIKQGYNYTFTQRKIILANIMENYNISKHEILSIIDKNIARKINLPNYSEAVVKWKKDREFVSNYKTGNVPEVIIDEIIIGKRK